MKKKFATILIIVALTAAILMSSWLVLKSGPDNEIITEIDFGPSGEEEAEQELQELLEEQVKETVEISFIDLGNVDAESILIQTKNHNILVDAGNTQAQDTLLEFLASKGVTRLDLFVLTNSYVGHVGGAHKVIAEVDINEVWENGIPSVITTYKAYKYGIAEKKIDKKVVTFGHSKSFDGVNFRVVSPFETKYSDSGDNSVVLEVTHGTVSMMLMSNCKVACEDGLVSSQNIQADIIKIGDYGSVKATTGPLLEMISPKIAIITGRGPSSQVKNALNEANINTYLTLDGTITIISDGAKYEITQ